MYLLEGNEQKVNWLEWEKRDVKRETWKVAQVGLNGGRVEEYARKTIIAKAMRMIAVESAGRVRDWSP